MMRNNVFILIATLSLSFSPGVTNFLAAQPNNAKVFVENWCDYHFDNCFYGRTFVEVTNIHRVTNHGEYTEVRGKFTYENFLGIPQNVSFRMYVYSNRIYFKKQSFDYNSETEQWEWVWEECSRRR